MLMQHFQGATLSQVPELNQLPNLVVAIENLKFWLPARFRDPDK
jgi:hypothetical protein